jgi:hypothetical protein
MKPEGRRMRRASFTRRTVHLVDLENVVGGSHLTESAVRQACAAYIRCGIVAPGDHVIVATSHHNLLAAGFGWPNARHLVRSGPNGADLALQEVMAHERLEHRFGACILLTGDGGFAHPVAALIGRGLPVKVIAPIGRMSAALKLAATASHELDFTDDADTTRSA